MLRKSVLWAIFEDVGFLVLAGLQWVDLLGQMWVVAFITL